MGLGSCGGRVYRPRVKATIGLGPHLPTTDSTVTFKHDRSPSSLPKDNLTAGMGSWCYAAGCIDYGLRQRSAWDHLWGPLTPLSLWNMPGPCFSTARIDLPSLLRASSLRNILRAFWLTNSLWTPFRLSDAASAYPLFVHACSSFPWQRTTCRIEWV